MTQKQVTMNQSLLIMDGRRTKKIFKKKKKAIEIILKKYKLSLQKKSLLKEFQGMESLLIKMNSII